MLDEVVRAAAHTFGDAPALVADETLSYADLHRRAGQRASALARTGIRVGDVVALVLPATADYIVNYAALAHESDGARASSGTDGWRLTGEWVSVIDGAVADVLVVVADGTTFAIEATASGLRRTPAPTMDQTRRQARVMCSNTPARRVDGDVNRGLDLGRVALAAEAVGGARWCLDATVAYAKTREQFGRPIGSFQALKHRMADMYVAVETAASTAEHAAWVAAHQPDQLPLVAAAAKVYCADAYAYVAQETIQLHGGIGFTWEHDAHLHLKRAWSTRQLLGVPTQLRKKVADLATF